MAVDDKAGLRFRIKADAKEAVQEINRVKDNVGKLGGAAAGAARGDFGALKDAFSGLADEGNRTTKIIQGAGLAVAATAGAAIGLGTALFALAKSASDYGSQIFDASEKTGLSAQTLTALKMAAEQSGSSFEEVSGALSKFNRLAGEAASGSEQAAKKLSALGIGPKDAVKDLEGALAQAIKRINELPSGALQTKAAMDAFGRSGANLIPVIKAADGDLAKLKKTAEELGISMSDAQARMSDEFGDALTQLQQQFKGLSFQIGSAMMPVFRSAMLEMSNWFSQNKDRAREFGTNAATALTNALKAAVALADFVSKYPEIFGAGAGAALGAMIGGPYGALIGGAAGALGGAALGYESQADRVRRRIFAGEDPNAVVTSEQQALVESTYPRTQRLFNPRTRRFDEGLLPRTGATAGMLRSQQKVIQDLNAQLDDLNRAQQEAAQAMIQGAIETDTQARAMAGAVSAGGGKASQGLQDATRAVQLAAEDIRDQITVKTADLQKALSTSIDVDAIGANVTNAKADLAELYKLLEENLKQEEALKLSGAKTNQEKLNIQAEYNIKRRQLAREQNDALTQLEEVGAARAIDLIKARNEKELNELRANNSKIEADLTESFNRREITEAEYLKRKLDLTRSDIQKQLDQQKAIRDDQNTTFLDREAAINKIRDLEAQLAVAVVQTEGQITAAYQRSADAKREILDATQAAVDQINLNAAEAAVQAAERDLQLKADTLFQIQKLVDAEKALALLRYNIRIAQINQEEQDAIKRVKGFEDEQKLITDIVNRYAEERKLALDDLNRATGTAETKGADTKAQQPSFTTGFFGPEGLKDFDDGAAYIESRVGAMKEMLGQSFAQMAQGVGSLVEQWVLYGELGPKALRKMTAAVLANLASQAAVEALMELARGFAKLANPFTAWQAPYHFTAAKIFGAVAVTAAVAGRAIAGGSFRNESGKAQSAQTSAQGSGGNRTGGPTNESGGTINVGRSSSSGFAPRAEIVIRDKSGMFGQLFAAEIEANSRVRQLIIDTASS